MRDEGIPLPDLLFHCSLDMRYRGQSYELTVPSSLTHSWEESFHRQHAATYGHSSPEQPTEIVQARLQAVGVMPKPALSRVAEVAGRRGPEPIARRPVRFHTWTDLPVFERCQLLPGHRLAGPALILQEDTTTLLAPGWSGAVDGWGNLLLSQA
jgi:N-methylhydantoinase A